MKLPAKTRIAVLMGGPGSEKEISLRSGAAVCRALQSGGHDVHGVEVQGRTVRIPEGTGLVFNMIHGTFGEDGELQELLEARGVPYTGEGVAASRVAFDKILSKERFRANEVATPRWEIIDSGSAPSLPIPYVVKAPREGSSVGVHIVKEEAQVLPALEDCARYASTILVEEYVQGRELTIGVLGERALPIVEIRPREGFYDYRNKYTKGASEYLVPAPIPQDVSARVAEMALAAFRAAGCEVYARVDVLLRDDLEPSVIEINTIPGMTETSLLPMAAQAVGIEFAELCEAIAVLSLERRQQ